MPATSVASVTLHRVSRGALTAIGLVCALAVTAPTGAAQSLASARAVSFAHSTAGPAIGPILAGAPQPQDAGGKDPFVAGVLSFIIPGVGSYYAGNSGHGTLHLGAHIGLYLLMVSAATNCYSDCTGVGIGALGILVNDIWSIFTAVNDAKASGPAGRPGRVVGDASGATLKLNVVRLRAVPADTTGGAQTAPRRQ